MPHAVATQLQPSPFLDEVRAAGVVVSLLYSGQLRRVGLRRRAPKSACLAPDSRGDVYAYAHLMAGRGARHRATLDATLSTPAVAKIRAQARLLLSDAASEAITNKAAVNACEMSSG